MNFPSAGIRANGRSPDEVFLIWEQDFPGEFYPYTVMNMTQDAYYEAIAREGTSFWIELEEYPWYRTLLDELSAIGEVMYLSATTYSPAGLSGKLTWLQQRFGVAFRDYIFTHHKDRAANAHAILIDDYEKNVHRFREVGGQAVLFPQIWNSNYPYRADRVAYTLGEIKRLTGQ